MAIPEWHKSDLIPDRHNGIQIIPWNDASLANIIPCYDVIIVSYCLGEYSARIAALVSTLQLLILDAYVPIHVEICARRASDRQQALQQFMHEHEIWSSVLRRGDAFLAASEAQKIYYLGVLSSVGRINPANYGEDPILIVPFGVDPGEPQPKERPCSRLVGADNTWKVLWFGGLYPWFDIESLLKSIIVLNKMHPTRLVIVGARNPFVGNTDFTRHYEQLLSLLKCPSISSLVHLVDWVPFEERADWFMDADLIVSVNQHGLENSVAWRTRIADYLWARVPVATNGGDPLSEEMIARGAAVKIFPEDFQQTADTIHCLLSNPPALESMRQGSDELRRKYLWGNVVQPLFGSGLINVPTRNPL